MCCYDTLSAVSCCENLNIELPSTGGNCRPYLAQMRIVETVVNLIKKQHATSRVDDPQDDSRQAQYAVSEKCYWDQPHNSDIRLQHRASPEQHGAEPAQFRFDETKNIQ